MSIPISAGRALLRTASATRSLCSAANSPPAHRPLTVVPLQASPPGATATMMPSLPQIAVGGHRGWVLVWCSAVREMRIQVLSRWSVAAGVGRRASASSTRWAAHCLPALTRWRWCGAAHQHGPSAGAGVAAQLLGTRRTTGTCGQGERALGPRASSRHQCSIHALTSLAILVGRTPIGARNAWQPTRIQPRPAILPHSPHLRPPPPHPQQRHQPTPGHPGPAAPLHPGEHAEEHVSRRCRRRELLRIRRGWPWL